MPAPNLPALNVRSDLSFPALTLPKLQQHGEQLAILEDNTGRELTFAQFVVTVKRLGATLLRLGVQQGDVLTICAHNCLEHILLLYALSRIGAIYHGVNAAFPEEDILYQISHSDTRYLVTDPATLPKVQRVLQSYKDVKGMFLVGDEVTEEIPSLLSLLTEDECKDISDGNPDFDARKMPMAMLYTSGTTGVPKAVLQSQYTYSYTNFMMGCEGCSTVQPGDVSVVMLPFFHALAQVVIMTHLMYCATKLVLIPNGLDFQNYLRTIEKYKADILWTNPPIVIKLATESLTANYDLSSVRDLVYAGAPVRKPIVDRLMKKLSSINMVRQLYGMSEMAVTAVSTAEVAKTKPDSCGLPLPGNLIKILDPDTKEEMGANQRGELFVKNQTQFLHYHKNPTKTAATLDEDGWIRTGDVAHYDQEGCLYVVDRVQDIIKYKNQNIYPSEIDTALLQHPGVEDVATIGVGREDLGQVPYCFIVCCKDDGISDALLKKQITESNDIFNKLDVEMEFVEQLPRNPAGKLLMQQLQEWAEDKGVPRVAFTDLTLRTT